MNNHSHHGHAHHGSHVHHAKPSYDRAFAIAIIANGLFVICQITFALLASSSSLLADAMHNLGDVLGLIFAWIADRLLKRRPTEKTTYGLKKTSILAALSNGGMLIFTCGIIVSDAFYKLIYASSVDAFSVMIVAGIGIVINGVTAALFIKGQEDLNIKAAYLHLLYDAMVSVGVVLSAALLYWTNWQWIDPVMGIIIALVILKGTWSMFRYSLRLIIDGVPQEISLSEVKIFLQAQAGVKEVHDLHIWALSTQENALSVHLLMPDSHLSDENRQQITGQLKEKYRIQHTTIQVEKNASFCEDACQPRCSSQS